MAGTGFAHVRRTITSFCVVHGSRSGMEDGSRRPVDDMTKSRKALTTELAPAGKVKIPD